MRLAPIKRKTSRTGLRAVAGPFTGTPSDWTPGAGDWPESWQAGEDTGDDGSSASVDATTAPWDATNDPAAYALGPKFGPFWLYGQSRVQALVSSWSVGDVRADAEESLATEADFWSERALWQGTDRAGDTLNVNDSGTVTAIPTLVSTATVTSGGGTARALTPTLDELITAMRAIGHKGPITFHTPDHAQISWFDTGILRQVGDQWLLAGEHPVVFGAGYTQLGPSAATAASTAAWIIASGPIEYAIDSAVRTYDGPATADDLHWRSARQNTVLARAKKLAGYRFNTITVYAAKSTIAGDPEA